MQKKEKFIKLLTLLLLAGIFLLVPAKSATAKKKFQNTPYQEYKYQQKVLRKLEIEKYKRGLLPTSGFMTKEEYENASKNIELSKTPIPKPEPTKNINMKYVPQPTYKLVRYNNPPGTAEIKLERKFKFDRAINAQGIASPDRSMLVYPTVYYYANSQSTAGDLFVIPLDKTLPDVERLMRANVARRIPKPILSTDKEICEPDTFRTMTPVDFSADGTKLIAKEKIGNTYDGIWQTNLWVYDFETQQSKKIPEIRDAIRFYWLNQTGERLNEKRWDIFPLGFDSNDPNRVVVSAYGYTGAKPKFLGTWSIDCNGEQSQLISLFNDQPEVSINGFKLVQDGIVNPVVIKKEEKKFKKTLKKKKHEAKKESKTKKHEAKNALNKKLHEMKKEESKYIKLYNKQNNVSKPTE